MPYVQLPLMWLLMLFTLRSRIKFTVVGVILLAFFVIGHNLPENHSAKQANEQSTDSEWAKKIAGMSSSQAFDYGRQDAHNTFDSMLKNMKEMDLQHLNEKRRKMGIPPLTRDNMDATLRSAFPQKYPPETIEICSREAESAGISDGLLKQYIDGYDAGCSEIKSGH